MNTSTPPGEDDNRIRELMETYLEGARTGDNAVLRPIFHELATICGYVGPDLFAGPIEMFYEWHDENGPAESVRADAPRIDVEGTAASVRIELHDWTGHRFTDFFTLVRVAGEWQILSKVFYLHPDS
ncbi:MAG: nuclear transport factor 2 family protein [Wenzhouxiangellaceae bacterium]|nr:nuclear transport factor 2 family protein [Wenzhouxiangellaceae bacterium]